MPRSGLSWHCTVNIQPTCWPRSHVLQLTADSQNVRRHSSRVTEPPGSLKATGRLSSQKGSSSSSGFRRLWSPHLLQCSVDTYLPSKRPLMGLVCACKRMHGHQQCQHTASPLRLHERFTGTHQVYAVPIKLCQ